MVPARVEQLFSLFSIGCEHKINTLEFKREKNAYNRRFSCASTLCCSFSVISKEPAAQPMKWSLFSTIHSNVYIYISSAGINLKKKAWTHQQTLTHAQAHSDSRIKFESMSSALEENGEMKQPFWFFGYQRMLILITAERILIIYAVLIESLNWEKKRNATNNHISKKWSSVSVCSHKQNKKHTFIKHHITCSIRHIAIRIHFRCFWNVPSEFQSHFWLLTTHVTMQWLFPRIFTWTTWRESALKNLYTHTIKSQSASRVFQSFIYFLHVFDLRAYECGTVFSRLFAAIFLFIFLFSLFISFELYNSFVLRVITVSLFSFSFSSLFFSFVSAFTLAFPFSILSSLFWRSIAWPVGIWLLFVVAVVSFFVQNTIYL